MLAPERFTVPRPLPEHPSRPQTENPRKITQRRRFNKREKKENHPSHHGHNEEPIATEFTPATRSGIPEQFRKAALGKGGQELIGLERIADRDRRSQRRGGWCRRRREEDGARKLDSLSGMHQREPRLQYYRRSRDAPGFRRRLLVA